MYLKNIENVLARIAPEDVVLDIGGWAAPFNRANYVADINPYENRGVFGSYGPAREFFSKDTWIIHDLSSCKPLPFKDKQIDFVICSHTLEDIRDPLKLCAEIIRVGRRGYIEVPSRTAESVLGAEEKTYAGYFHHRWLVDIKGSEIIFRAKPHLLHASWKLHLPVWYGKKMTEEQKVQFLFWDDSFSFKEVIVISAPLMLREYEQFIRSTGVYPDWYYKADAMRPKNMAKNILLKHPALRKMIEKALGRRLPLGQDNIEFWEKVKEIELK
jgi:SAM-dependent methyltransferase